MLPAIKSLFAYENLRNNSTILLCMNACMQARVCFTIFLESCGCLKQGLMNNRVMHGYFSCLNDINKYKRKLCCYLDIFSTIVITVERRKLACPALAQAYN